MRIRREKVSALVLARRDVGEADRLLTLFTREHGLVRAEAKGVRRIPSRRGGHLEPLTRIVCLLAGGHGRYFISAAESEELFGSLQHNAAAQQVAERLAAVALRTLQLEEPHPELYDALHDVFASVAELPSAKRDLLEIGCTFFALEQAGFKVDLAHCVRCRAARPEASAVLTGAAGGWQCLTCSSSFSQAQQALSFRNLTALRWLAEHPHSALRLKVSDEEGRELQQAVQQLVSEIVQPQENHVAIR